MKAFLMALVLIAAISVGANLALREAAHLSSAEVFSTESVRLGE